MTRNLDTLIKEAKGMYDRLKKSYEEISFVTRSPYAICCNCGKNSTKCYWLSLRCMNTKKCPWNKNNVGKQNHRFYSSIGTKCIYCFKTKRQIKQAEYKNITWVCSKPCETMLILR